MTKEALPAAARLVRLARTLSHLHPAQLAFRPVHELRTRLLARSPAVASLIAGREPARAATRILALGDGTLPADLPGLAEDLERARRALAGEQDLVGRTVRIEPPNTEFAPDGAPKLLRYQVAYLGIVRSLALAARTERFDRRSEAAGLALAHLGEFLERFPPGRGDAWEPYVVATRLLNLLQARELLRPVATGADARFLDEELPKSLAAHARWLAWTLELHLLGNHLFTDGAALFAAGCALEAPGSGLWRRLGQAILERSVRVDALSDGGHSERSPMYAALWLDQVLYAIAAARARGVAEPAGALQAAERAGRQLLAIAHPDGGPPLLGDTALGEAPVAADLAGALGLAPDSLRRRLYGPPATEPAQALEKTAVFSDTGLAVARDGGSVLVVDAGPAGTPDQPGHAHADALSFEWSRRGTRLVVDGGAGHYEADALRAYFRGPLAHSAVSVDGEGPDELWSAFRAARRGVPGPLRLAREGELVVLEGSVRAAGGWTHRRLFVHLPDALLAVFDAVTGARPEARVLSHLHLAPGVEVRLGGREAALRAPAGPMGLHLLAGDGWEVREGEGAGGAPGPLRGWTAWRLGRPEPSPEVCICATAGWAAWALADPAGPAAVQALPGGAWIVAAGGARIRIRPGVDRWRWEPAAAQG